MKITPALLSQVLEGLTPRVRKRAETLAADVPQPVPDKVQLGTAVVSVGGAELLSASDELTCDCLLAPGCAHRAAVALRLDLATDEDQDTDAATEERAAPPGAAEPDQLPARPAGSVGLTEDQRSVIRACRGHLAQLIDCGFQRLPIDLRSALIGDLHRLRSAGLVLADKALTGVLAQGASAEARAASLQAALLNLWELERAEPAQVPDLIGTARQRYTKVGALKLQPLCVEPVLTASGFSGVAVLFADDQLRVWSLSRVQAGDVAMVDSRYRSGADWGGSSLAPKELGRRAVLVVNATASSQGRLGGGSQVRVTASEPTDRWSNLPKGYQVVQGSITGGDRFGLDVAGQRLILGQAATKLRAGLGTELFSQTGAQVKCLARASASGWQLTGMEPQDDLIQLPDSLAGVWFPGVDQVARDWVGALAPLDQERTADPSQWPTGTPAVGTVLRRWVCRIADGGSATLTGDAWRRDAAWLRAAAAPLAADLLAKCFESTASGSRRFDGSWRSDPAALSDAWLALAVY